MFAVPLMAAVLATGCGDTGADSAVDSPESVQAAAVERAAEANFEGTLQQVVTSVGAEAIRSIAGTSDPQAIVDFPAERVLEAVESGEVEPGMLQETTMEIKGPMARMQAVGDPTYTILDGREGVARVVDTENQMIMTMNPAAMAEAASAHGEQAEAPQFEVTEVGEASIRGYDATGYRFDFVGDNVATVWLSEELGESVGPIFDLWFAINPFGQIELGAGAPIRIVVVNKGVLESGGNRFVSLPAYTITDFYNLEQGDISDERFALPEGYQERSLADLAAGAGANSND